MAEPADERAEQIRGVALMLLTGVLVGLVSSFVLRTFHGGVYVPILMPGLVGWGLGVILARIHLRFGVAPRWPGLATAAFSVVLAYACYHLLVYLRITGFLADHMSGVIERAASDPLAEMQLWFESETGEEGWFAFLAFTSTGDNAGLSPLGLYGRLEPGLGGTLIGIAAELLAGIAAAAFMFSRVVRRASRVMRPSKWADSGRRQREEIAQTDAATLVEAMKAIDRGAYDVAGRVLAREVERADHVLTLSFDPENQTLFELEIAVIGGNGQRTVRVTRELDGWHGQELWDELRLSRERDPDPN